MKWPRPVQEISQFGLIKKEAIETWHISEVPVVLASRLADIKHRVCTLRSDETHQDRSKNNKKRRFIYIKFRCNDLLSLQYNLSIKSNNIYIWQLRLRIYTTFRWSIISQWGGRSRWEFKQFVVCNNIYNTDPQVWLGFSVLMCHAIQIFVPGSLDQLSVTALEDMFN